MSVRMSSIYSAIPNNPKTNWAKVPKAVRKDRKNGPVRTLKLDGDGNLAPLGEFKGRRISLAA